MTGVFDHSIDAKGRLFIPSRLREKLGEEFQIAVGRDFSLTLYPLAEWEALRELVNKEPDAKKRETSEMIFAYSVRCSVDAQNRVMIPPNLREYALLEKDVTVRGEVYRQLKPLLESEDLRQREVGIRALRYALSALAEG